MRIHPQRIGVGFYQCGNYLTDFVIGAMNPCGKLYGWAMTNDRGEKLNATYTDDRCDSMGTFLINK